MSTFLAVSPVWAKAYQVELAERFPNMLLATPWAERAEAPVVVRAWTDFRSRVDVKIEAVVAVATVECSRILIAFGHTPSI